MVKYSPCPLVYKDRQENQEGPSNTIMFLMLGQKSQLGQLNQQEKIMCSQKSEEKKLNWRHQWRPVQNDCTESQRSADRALEQVSNRLCIMQGMIDLGTE